MDARAKDETIPELIFWDLSNMHPSFEGLKEPYVVQKILKSAMLGEPAREALKV